MVFDYSLVALGLLATFRAVESRALRLGPEWTFALFHERTHPDQFGKV
jgi:hypothetical protein